MPALLLVSFLSVFPAGAVEPGEMLRDPSLETRAREISAGLRCLVCQNQSIDDSEAPLAKDLRILVRERLTAGDSDGNVRNFLLARYGPYILLRPPWSPATILLWTMPALCLAFGGLAIALVSRNRRVAPATSDLDPGEEAALQRLTGEADGSLSVASGRMVRSRLSRSSRR